MFQSPAEVARELDAPLDVFTVRKLGLPDQPELAMGAIATGGVRVLNNDVVDSLRVPQAVLEEVTTSELKELQRREHVYRDDSPPLEVEGKSVIVVDDGVATGSSMVAAVSALRQLGARRILVAAPIIAHSTCEILRRFADEVVAILTPIEFYGVGAFYQDFSQTSDDEVRDLLIQARNRFIYLR